MQTVYLGLFSWLFDAIFDAILSPIINFIGGILSDLLQWLFENILEPILMKVFIPLVEEIIKIIVKLLAGLFYSIQIAAFQLIDSMQTAFNVFAGLQTVTADGKEYRLMNYVFSQSVVQRSFWSIALISFFLIFFFTILSTIRSIADIDEVSRPVGRVLRSSFQAFLKVLLVPAVTAFALVLASQLLVAANQVTSLGFGQENSDNPKLQSLSNVIFVTASLDAVRDDIRVGGRMGSDWNISGDSSREIQARIGINDPVRNLYYRFDPFSKTGNQGKMDCRRLSDVQKYFDIGRYDYVIGLISSVFVILVLAGALLIFVSRMFEVAILFIVSPFFASVIPLDDGEKFKSWQELFVGKVFGGFGMVIAMNVYFLVLPAVMSGGLSFADGTAEANYLMRLIFICGGAWAMYHVGPSITSLLSEAAGWDERRANQMTYGMMRSGANYAWAGVKSAFRSKQEGKDGEDNKQDGKLKNGKNGPKDEKGKAMDKFAKSKDDANAMKKKQKVSKGFGFRREKGKDGKMHRHLTANFGRVFSNYKDANGKRHFSLLGFGYTSKNGVKNSVRVPFAKFKRDSQSGKMKCTSFNGGLYKLKRSVTKGEVMGADGKMHKTRNIGGFHVSDISAIGLHRSMDEKTGEFHTDKAMGFGFRTDEDGVKHRSFLGHEYKTLKKGDDGKYHTESVNYGLYSKQAVMVKEKGADGQEKLVRALKVDSVPVLGIKKSYDEKNHRMQTDVLFGREVMDTDTRYHTTDYDFMAPKDLAPEESGSDEKQPDKKEAFKKEPLDLNKDKK